VLDLLDLMPIRSAMVGAVGAGLSTEERKRLTIGVELVANPSIIFADEPTSGKTAPFYIASSTAFLASTPPSSSLMSPHERL
jgi:ABC-type branched-subunit amino acid transport system ATPase component